MAQITTIEVKLLLSVAGGAPIEVGEVELPVIPSAIDGDLVLTYDNSTIADALPAAFREAAAEMERQNAARGAVEAFAADPTG